MKTNYKFWYIYREDDVHINECAIRLYEGEITTLDEADAIDSLNPVMVPITRYRPSKRLKIVDLPHFVGKKTKREMSGADCIIFTDEDFGVISTNKELVKFLNKELKKDVSRTPIDEQVDNEQ